MILVLVQSNLFKSEVYLFADIRAAYHATVLGMISKPDKL